jgi:hypothetical protein
MVFDMYKSILLIIILASIIEVKAGLNRLVGKDSIIELTIQLPRYIVCESSDPYSFEIETKMDDEDVPDKNDCRFFLVSDDKLGNRNQLFRKTSFIDQNVFLFEDGSGNPEKKKIPDFYSYIGNYWNPDISQASDKDVRELNKKFKNKYFKLVLVSFTCESDYDEKGRALDYKRDNNGNIIPGSRPKGKTEIRYYIKSIEEVKNISNKLKNKGKVIGNDINSMNDDIFSIIPLPFNSKNEDLTETVQTILKKINSSKENNSANPGNSSNGINLFDKTIDKFYYSYDGSDFLENQINLLSQASEQQKIGWNYIFSKSSRAPTEIMRNSHAVIQDECTNQEERGFSGLCTINIFVTLTNKINDTLLFPRNKGYNSLLDSLHTGLFTYMFHNNKLVCINYKNVRMTGSSLRPDRIQYSNKVMSLLTKKLGKPKAWYGVNSSGAELIEYYYDYGKSCIVLSGVRKGYYGHEKKDPFRINNISYINKYEENIFLDSTILTQYAIKYSDGESTATPWFNYLYSKEKRH